MSENYNTAPKLAAYRDVADEITTTENGVGQAPDILHAILEQSDAERRFAQAMDAFILDCTVATAILDGALMADLVDTPEVTPEWVGQFQLCQFIALEICAICGNPLSKCTRIHPHNGVHVHGQKTLQRIMVIRGAVINVR